MPSTIICKYFFSPVCFPLLIQSLKLNSWKSREVVPVTPIRQIPSGSWQQPSRPPGEEHPACTCLAAPCTFLGLFQPLPGAEQPAGKPNQKTHERFAATVAGDIFILLKYLLWVNVSCPAEMCVAASQKNPSSAIAVISSSHGLFPSYCFLARDNFSHVPISVFFLYVALDERRAALQWLGLPCMRLMLRTPGAGWASLVPLDRELLLQHGSLLACS